MEVSSGQSMWWIPPHFALWIPARTQHRIYMPGSVSMRTLYLRSGLIAGLTPGCSVLHVSSLLRELILETVRLGQLRMRNPLERALRDLTVAHLEKASPVPACVIWPRDARAMAVAQRVVDDPSGSNRLPGLCAGVGVSVRTIQRAFRKEVGMDFESWRRQMRLMKAIELLVAGSSVKEVAFAVGYRQSSAFVDAFRRLFGTTPKAWIAALDKLDENRSPYFSSGKSAISNL